ncbi:MAG: hypothetical protein ACT4OF_04650 [Caulobacteraceae bacterium]
MRTLALATVIGVGLFTGGLAFAEQWTDPNGLLTFNAPSGWRVQPRGAPGQTVVLAFNAANDCYFYGAPNPATTNSSANAARNSRAPLAPEAWVTVASPVRDFFGDGPPTFVSQSVDTSGFWPVQRAELRGPSKTVYGAILLRPGVEIRAFCSGADSATAYDAIFASLGHPNDQTWQSQAAEQAAQQQSQAEQPQQEEQQPERRRRGRGLSTEPSNTQPSGM